MIRLLLCDDDESNRLTTSALLEDAGFAVDLAASFVEAENLIRAANAAYALLIFDQNLGDGLGSALAEIARARLPAAKVVLLTGADRVETSAVDALIHKGQSFDHLLESITVLLAS